VVGGLRGAVVVGLRPRMAATRFVRGGVSGYKTYQSQSNDSKNEFDFWVHFWMLTRYTYVTHKAIGWIRKILTAGKSIREVTRAGGIKG